MINSSNKTTQQRRLAVVTGASSGIGYELARQFAENNFDLIIAAEDSGIERAARDLESRYDIAVDSIQCDLREYDGVEELFRCMESHGASIEAVAINAGIGLGGRFEETSLDREIDLINLNVTSTVHLAKRVVQHMLRRGRGGRLLFTSSIAATMPGPYEAVYAASKAFIQSFSEALRYEMKGKGIKVTALMPGPTETNFFHRAEMDDTKVGANPKDDPAQVAKQGYEALMNDDDHVIAGSIKTKLQNAANDLIPEQIKAGMHANMAKPGSAAARASRKNKDNKESA